MIWFSFYQSFSYSFEWWTSWSIWRYLKNGDLKLYKLKHHRGCCLFFNCNYVLLSKASNLDIEIDRNELYLIPSLRYIGYLVLLPWSISSNVWRILLDKMMFRSECYWNNRMFMNTYLCFPRQTFLWQLFSNKVDFDFWSQHPWKKYWLE